MYLYLFTSTVWKFICTVCSTVFIIYKSYTVDSNIHENLSKQKYNTGTLEKTICMNMNYNYLTTICSVF